MIIKSKGIKNKLPFAFTPFHQSVSSNQHVCLHHIQEESVCRVCVNGTILSTTSPEPNNRTWCGVFLMEITQQTLHLLKSKIHTFAGKLYSASICHGRGTDQLPFSLASNLPCVCYLPCSEEKLWSVILPGFS